MNIKGVSGLPKLDTATGDYPSKSPYELEEIAQGICTQKVFSHLNLPKDNPSAFLFIFHPLQELEQDDLKAFMAKAGLLYQYLKKSPGSVVPGYPSFTEFLVLNRNDAEVVIRSVDEIKTYLSNRIRAVTN